MADKIIYLCHYLKQSTKLLQDVEVAIAPFFCVGWHPGRRHCVAALRLI